MMMTSRHTDNALGLPWLQGRSLPEIWKTGDLVILAIQDPSANVGRLQSCPLTLRGARLIVCCRGGNFQQRGLFL